MSVAPALDRPRMPVIFIKVLLETVADWKVAPETLLQGTGITLKALEDNHFSVDYAVFIQLHYRAIQLTQEPGLGFLIGRKMKFSSFGLVAYAAMVTSTLRELIDVIEQFLLIRIPFARVRLELQTETAYLYFGCAWLDLNKEMDRMLYEVGAIYAVLVSIEIIPMLSGQAVKPEVDFSFKRPDYIDRFEGILSSTMARVRFGQPESRIAFPAHYLDLPLKFSDPSTARRLRKMCQQQLDFIQAKRDITVLVRELIYCEKDGLQSIEVVAAKLRLSKRTLQRLLKNANQNFNALYDQTREQTARMMIQRGDLSLNQIAIKLGYATNASFSRAFKRWTQKTPGQYIGQGSIFNEQRVVYKSLK
ncbi:AraC family transcriptional regulator [Aquirhabdus parva]|uniref:AraC family transcriptional regulator n=1 Tax=Aquirhabdus parva TaxID=2283318 RepID=A0A345PA09_9GAMM|nr:AraC family transcriptional regulator [Aquirhabdus parva]AXI04118.1 AraC family transcriptional regulator [Aquirhabdus parva]